MYTLGMIVFVVLVVLAILYLVAARKNNKNVVGEIVTSVKNRVVDGLNDVKDAVSDPVLNAKVNIEKVKDQISNFTESIVNLMAKVNQDKNKLDGYEAEVKKWESIYTAAVEANNEADQNTASEHLERADTRLEALKSSIKSNEAALQTLVKRKEEYERALESAEINLERLTAQNQDLELRQQALNSGNGIGLGALSELEELVRNGEARVEAMQELNTDAGEKLEDKYGVGNVKHNERLAKLKERVAVNV